MHYTDLHCDTLFELYKKGLKYQNDILHLRADFENVFDSHTQVFSVWTQNRISDEDAWTQFHAILDHAEKAGISPSVNRILAVEGGALLAKDISRVDTLFQMGVRMLTLVWQDHCEIGGAWNTEEGLTEFGFDVVDRCLSLGIHPDLSHASDKMFWQVAERLNSLNKPLLATHSNSRAICDHRRNLTDEMFTEVVKSEGVAGISMASIHLAKDGNATLDDVIRHIEHYFSLGGQQNVCLGCDFDGISSSPKEIKTMYDLPLLADRLARLGYSDCQIEGIFYKNADRFLRQTFKSISV